MATIKRSVDQYLPIAVETLLGAGDAQFDLYFQGNDGPMLFRARNVPMVDDLLERLIRSGVKTLFITHSDRAAYEQHLHDRAEAGGDLPAAGKYSLLMGSARTVFESALRGDNVQGMVSAAEQFGTHLTDMLSDGDLILRDLFHLMLHDYYTFTHSANVATYCVGIARELGLDNRDELAQIAAGALLHDVGKRKIPRRVLNAPKRLSPEEREIIQRHPQIGFEELSPGQELSWGQLMMVYQHHERFDGRGYPVAVEEDEIDPWARICAVADVFDALTSNRPYRKAISIASASEFLEKRAGSCFDSEAVQCLTSMMQSG